MYVKSNKGHISNIQENIELLEAVANDKKYIVDIDIFHNIWFSKLQNNNTEVWIKVHNHTIINGGINEKPRIWTNSNNLNYKNTYPKKDKLFLTGLAVYDIMLYFLKNYYEKTNSLYVAGFLSDMIFLYDNESADPRAFDFWKEYIKKNNAFTMDRAYLSMLQLIEIFYFKNDTPECYEFWKYVTPVNGIIPQGADLEWNKAVDFILTNADSRQYIQWQK